MREAELVAYERLLAHVREQQLGFVRAEVYLADVTALVAAVRKLKAEARAKGEAP